MSEKRARYSGPNADPDGADITIPLANGEIRHRRIPHSGEVPTEIDGISVPASFRDSLLEQKDNWSEVNRATGTAATGKAPTKKES